MIDQPFCSRRPEPPGFFVYYFHGGQRYEACRPYFEAQKNADGQDCLEVIDPIQDGIRLCLNSGSNSRVVFVRPAGTARPVYACWRAEGRTKGPWRTLRFCQNCPDPEVCGYLSRTCRLSPNGKPQRAFRPKPVRTQEDEVPILGGYIQAVRAGQIWLNSIENTFQVLHEMHGRVWQIECQLLGGEIYPKESYFRRQLEIRWTAAIFEGRNPQYAVMPWNTDPAQLRTHILKKYYGEELDTNPEDWPSLDEAVLALVDACAYAVTFQFEWMLENATDEISDALLHEAVKNLADDAAYHTRFLLGLPPEIELAPVALTLPEIRPVVRR